MQKAVRVGAAFIASISLFVSAASALAVDDTAKIGTRPGSKYFGSGRALEDAVRAAHEQIPPPPQGDVTYPAIVGWGAQFGYPPQQWSFRAKVVATDNPNR